MIRSRVAWFVSQRPLAMAAGLVALLALAGGVAAGIVIGVGGSGSSALATEPTPTPTATATPTPVPPTPTPAPTGAGFDGGPAGSYEGRAAETGHRLVIPSLGVDAAVTARTVPESGVMGDPNGPWDVTWYDFTNFPGLGGYPGGGGNSVFAGHVDYVNVGPAVFYGVPSLKPGDVIEVHRADGMVVRYAVDSVTSLSPSSDEWGTVFSMGPQESVTLVTCGGVFNPATRQYDTRIVVKGTRIPEESQPSGPGGVP